MRLMILTALCLLATESLAQEKSTLRVGNSTGMGTGTVVHREGSTVYVLTCKHVVDGKRDVFVVHAKKLHVTTVFAVSKDDDLALVKVDLKDIEPVTVAKDDLKDGDKVTHFGVATGPLEGKITGHTLFASSQGKMMNTDAMCVAGDSGGGFYKDGKLVGVLCGRIHKTKGDKPEDGETFFCRLERVQIFLKDNLPKGK